MGLAARFSAGLLALLVSLAALSCKPKASGAREDAAAPLAPLPVMALQAQPELVSRLELTQPGGEPVTLEAAGDGWRMVSPISFPANLVAVETMLEVLAELEVQRRVAERPEPEHRLGRMGVVVKVWTSDGIVREFTVGASAGDETYVQRADETQVYTVQGRCRHLFEWSFTELRHPVITELEPADIERVVYTNQYGELELVADPENPGRFVEPSPTIQNFNGERASKNVAVLAGLRAKGFVDPPVDKAATGLFDEDTARAAVSIRGRETPLLVWMGARTRDRRLHVRTSDSEQVYLVSAHLASSLIPQERHFERSDEEMRELQAQQKAREATAGAEAAVAHDPEHTHDSPPPTEVPPTLLRELRELAQEQRR